MQEAGRKVGGVKTPGAAKFIANMPKLRKPKKEICKKNPQSSLKFTENMTDWPIKTLARTSFVSGRVFALGEQVTSVIYRGADGLLRADLGAEEAEGWQAPGEVLGRWVREVEDEDAAAQRRQALASAEEMFLALAQESGGAGPDKEMLMQFLALQLERKRVLRPVGRPAGGQQRYMHLKTQQEYVVAQAEMSAEGVAALQKQLHHLAY